MSLVQCSFADHTVDDRCPGRWFLGYRSLMFSTSPFGIPKMRTEEMFRITSASWVGQGLKGKFEKLMLSDIVSHFARLLARTDGRAALFQLSKAGLMEGSCATLARVHTNQIKQDRLAKPRRANLKSSLCLVSPQLASCMVCISRPFDFQFSCAIRSLKQKR